jgi:CheY-like chemotaxis protein
MAGKLFLNDVVEAFINMMQEEILNLQTVAGTGQILIYASTPDNAYPLELRLKNEGFRTVIANSQDSLIELYNRRQPDVIVLSFGGKPDDIQQSINRLIEKGIDIRKTPTFVLADKGTAPQLSGLYEKGIEDIIAENGNYDLMLVKIKKILKKAESPASRTTGATGRLADMNLIDLMQALAPGRKTVKVTIISDVSPSDTLEIYLDKGNIIYGRLKEKYGAEAIYEGMIWTDGKWTVEPVDSTNLPQPNNQLSNDAILMEGAYQLDEKIRAGQL